MTDTKINPHAEIHAKATKRTPSRQYPQGQMIAADEADDDYYDSIESAMWSLVNDYEIKHGTLPPDDWRPSVYWHGVKKVKLPFDPDDWAQVILEECVEETVPPSAARLAERIVNFYYENAYDDWDQGWGDQEDVEQALAPALAYAAQFGEFGDPAELARLLAPVGEIVSAWFLGYEEDSDHAVDIEPEHVAHFVRNWTVREDEPEEEPKP